MVWHVQSRRIHHFAYVLVALGFPDPKFCVVAFRSSSPSLSRRKNIAVGAIRSGKFVCISLSGEGRKGVGFTTRKNHATIVVAGEESHKNASPNIRHHDLCSISAPFLHFLLSPYREE